MKNLGLLLVLSVFSLSSYGQDGLLIEVNAGLPLGDANDFYTFNASTNVGYLWDVSEDFDVGASAGYSMFFGEDNIDDASFIPLAGMARYNLSEGFKIGADVGYAIGIDPEGNDGGFYYVPRVQYAITETIDIVLAYRGIAVDGGSVDALTLGVEFKI